MPNSSWFHQLPIRPIPWASRIPGAAASAKRAALAPERRTTMAPTSTPSPTPPQTPSPPLQTSTTPCHFGVGTSFHEVMS